MAQVGQLVVDLRAATASFAADLGRAKQLAFNNSKEIERSFRIMGTAITGAVVSAAGATLALAARSIESADQMGKLAQRTGTTVEQFSSLAHAAKLSDVDTRSLSTSLVTLAKNLERSNVATQEGKAANQALGTLFRGNIPVFKDTDDAFVQISARLAELPDGYQKTALAAQLMGAKTGAAMIPMTKGLAEARQEAQDLGLVITEQAAKAAEHFNDNLTRLGGAVTGLGNRLAQELLPYLTNLTDQMVDFAKSAASSSALVDTLKASVQVLATATVVLAGGLYIAGNALATFLLGVRILAQTAPIVGLAFGDLGRSLDLFNASLGITKNSITGVGGLLADIWKQPTAAAFDFDKASKNLQERFSNNLPSSIQHSTEKVTEFITKLRDEIFLFGKSASETARYQAAKLGASQASQELAGSLARELELLKQLAKPMQQPNLPKRPELGPLLIGTPDIPQIEAPEVALRPLAVDMSALSASVATVDDQLREQAKILNFENRPAAQKYNEEIDKLRLLYEVGGLSTEAFSAEVRKLGEQFGRTGQLVLQVRQSTAEMFTQAIFRANSFGEAMGNILQRLAETIFQLTVLQPLLDRLFSSSKGGGIGGLFGKIFGSIAGAITGGGASIGSAAASIPTAQTLGPVLAFADGGMAMAGKPYIVGEKGPEIFWPGRTGTVTPNDFGVSASGGSGGGILDTIIDEIAGLFSGVSLDLESLQLTPGAALIPSLTPMKLPGLATGGTAFAGNPYLVGEEGPELFWPGRTGTVTPNGVGMGGNVTYNIDARGAQRGVDQEILRALRATEDRAVRRSQVEILETRARKGGGR